MTTLPFINREELIHLIETLYPTAKHGVNYIATHPVRGEVEDPYLDIAGDAVVWNWAVDETPPTADDIQLWKKIHAAKLEAFRNPPPEKFRERMPPLTRRQFRLAMLNAGVDTAEVEAAIAAILEPTQRARAQIEWQDASHYERLHPLVVDLSSALGLPAEQLDAQWEHAASI